MGRYFDAKDAQGYEGGREGQYMEVQSLRDCFGIGFVPPALPGVNEIPAPPGRAGDVSSGVREMREMWEMRGVRGIRCGGV